MADRLEVYYRLLASWNTKINLTGLNLADTTPESIDRLLVEPLVAAKYVPPGVARMIDIGSGGGSPAIPLALAIPGVQLVMVESKTRKSVFLREAVRALELPDAEVVTARVEELLARPDLHETQDLVTVRAVRIEASLFTTLQAFTKPGGSVFMFRGAAADPQWGDFSPLLTWRATFPLVEATRDRLLVFEKRKASLR
ncbi:MAG: 16S rRNA (guanine(527)-N(7))-methyltransferase RsmG [Acidobacteria bacterium]|nr:16S rRNA (guanine(527)-N(7))-methyltransferase RsmG [Acidobacteriota bacterium]